MKLIKAIVRPEKALPLKDLSCPAQGIMGLLNTECHGYGESKNIIKQVYRGKVYEQRVDAVKRTELEFVVPDDKVENVYKNN